MLRLEHVSFAVNGKYILEDINLTIEITALRSLPDQMAEENQRFKLNWIMGIEKAHKRKNIFNGEDITI